MLDLRLSVSCLQVPVAADLSVWLIEAQAHRKTFGHAAVMNLNPLNVFLIRDYKVGDDTEMAVYHPQGLTGLRNSRRMYDAN